MVPVNVAQKTLDLYYADVDGGKSVLIVSPTGESLLFDPGTSDPRHFQGDNILKAIKEAGLQQIDYLITSHYHGDHVGNLPYLASKLPIRRFYDHGAWTTENAPGRNAGFLEWMTLRDHVNVTVPTPGEKIPITGIDVTFVAGAGKLLKTAVAGAPGAGAPNPFCADSQPKVQDPTPENAEALGLVLKYNNFRMLDLADLTWNQEIQLACPNNLLGTFDVYNTTRHGTGWSGAPALVKASRARVAVMNNGSRKGGEVGTFEIIHSIPGFEDLWQNHYSVLVDKAHNPPDDFVANLDDLDHGYAFKMSVKPDGSFTVKNERNGFTKEYKAKKPAGPQTASLAAPSTGALNR
jgi:beta-lactamase superfamily II metal-dependent hydrolase